MISNIKKACIFDVDGTIAETEALHLQAFNEAFTDFDIGWIWSKSLYKELLRIAGSSNRIKYFNSKTNSNLSTQLIESLTDRKTKIYQDKLITKSFNIRPGVKELVDALGGRMKIGVATSTSDKNVKKLFSLIWGNKAQKIFSVISTPNPYIKNKPAPDLYNLALKKMKVDPKDAVAIEDSEIGLLSAKSAFIPTIVVPSEFTLEGNFSEADLVVEDLLDPRVTAFLGIK